MHRLSCEEVFSRLDDYLDRELKAEEMARVREHLETCAACAAEYRFESSVIQGVRNKLEHLAMPSDLLAKIRASIAETGAAPA